MWIFQLSFPFDRRLFIGQTSAAFIHTVLQINNWTITIANQSLVWFNGFFLWFVLFFFFFPFAPSIWCLSWQYQNICVISIYINENTSINRFQLVFFGWREKNPYSVYTSDDTFHPKTQNIHTVLLLWWLLLWCHCHLLVAVCYDVFQNQILIALYVVWPWSIIHLNFKHGKESGHYTWILHEILPSNVSNS